MIRVLALSVVAPAGLKIAQGQKTIEVRSWLPGDLESGEDLVIVENSRYLKVDGDSDPDGLAVALVKIARVRSFTPEDIAASCATRYELGWYSWVLENVRPAKRDFRVLAARKLYEVEVPADLF